MSVEPYTFLTHGGWRSQHARLPWVCRCACVCVVFVGRVTNAKLPCALPQEGYRNPPVITLSYEYLGICFSGVWYYTTGCALYSISFKVWVIYPVTYGTCVNKRFLEEAIILCFFGQSVECPVVPQIKEWPNILFVLACVLCAARIAARFLFWFINRRWSATKKVCALLLIAALAYYYIIATHNTIVIFLLFFVFVQEQVKELIGIKESDTGLSQPSQWDLVSDKQMMQEEQPLQVRNDDAACFCFLLCLRGWVMDKFANHDHIPPMSRLFAPLALAFLVYLGILDLHQNQSSKL